MRHRAPAILAAAVLAVLTVGCGLVGRNDPPPTITLPADYASVLDSTDLPTFRQLARDGVTIVSPATTRLVGPTYGVAFDALGIAHSFDGLLFEMMSSGLAADDIGHRYRGEHLAGDGHEFLLAHVIEDHLPEPTLGYGTLFLGWKIDVGGTIYPLTRLGAAADVGTSAIIVVSVPVGADARLSERALSRMLPTPSSANDGLPPDRPVWWRRRSLAPTRVRSRHATDVPPTVGRRHGRHAKFWHDHAINHLAYGFPYDDYAGQSSFISHGSPQYLLIAVGW